MPGGNICSVATCKSNSNTAKAAGEHIMFFTFPKNPRIRKEWVRRCARKDPFSPEWKRICSKHFKSDDFEDELKARLLGTHAKKLKKDAIPSLLVPVGPTTSSKFASPSNRAKRAEHKEKKKLLAELLETSTFQATSVDNVAHGGEPPEDESCFMTTEHKNFEDAHPVTEALKKENADLRQKLEALMETEASLRLKVSDLEKKLQDHRLSFHEKASQAFKDFLTMNQIKIAMKTKTKARWTQEELSRAFTIRYFSKRCYLFLRNKLHYPLPGISTLQHWAVNLNMQEGILTDVLKVMNASGIGLSDVQRATVISFDEMKVSSVYEYDQKNDDVVGPHDQMQVIMARGLVGNWKQPVHISFDQKVTKRILDDVICKLHDISYNVVACVSDCGGGNQGLWRELNLGSGATFTPHPVTGEPIQLFADAPHLLKLLRNWFLDTGFLTTDGEIDKSLVTKLIETNVSEISSCYKLTPLHVNCNKTKRQNVRLAAQLFSNSTATALLHYMPDEDRAKVNRTSDFIKLVNNWFDIMNSYTPTASVPAKKPFSGSEIQLETLNKMKDTISGMLCVGKNQLQVFQKGIIKSIISVQELLKHMKEKYGVSYLLTHRLNQDCLENFFSQIRTRGGLHDHPSPLNAIHRIRMILLGKHPGIVQSSPNVELPDSEASNDYFFTKAIKQAKIAIPSDDSEGINPLKIGLEDFPEEASSTSSSSNVSSNRDAREKDGLEYIAGYLAKKHLKSHPQLGCHTYKIGAPIHDYSIPSWVQHLSFGGLIQPSPEWDAQTKIMDHYFQKLSKATFSSNKSVVQNCVEYLSRKVPEVPLELIKSFCRLRVLLRIRYLNQKKEEAKSLKRQSSAERKIEKKMRKIVN